MMCCDEARKMDGRLSGEYDELFTTPAAEFRAQCEAEHGKPIATSYRPPEADQKRIGEIVALRRKISDGWCPVCTAVH